MSRAAKLATLVLALVLVAAGIIWWTQRYTAPDPTPTGEKAPSGLERFYDQDVSWKGCGEGDDRCATIRVPLDYDEPDGDTIGLAVRYRPADRPDPIGALLLNPGGPGGSGIEYLPAFVGDASSKVLDRYDVVGFDPRGVADSDPVECLSDRQFADFTEVDGSPDDDEEIAALGASFRELGEGCTRSPVAAHMSTEEAARDMDVLRALFGDDTLHYYGASYGTQLGATYATLFPQKAGRLVLDGAVDPSLSPIDSAAGQNEGFARAITAYADDAGKSVDDIAAFVDGLDTDPLPTASGRDLSQTMATYGIAVAMYDKRYWTVLTQALDLAMDDGDGSALLQLADAYFKRNPDGSYADNSGEAIYAVNCADSNREGAPVSEARGEVDRFRDVSPVFGSFLAWGSIACDGWPVQTDHPQVEIDGEGAPPILVVGTTRDPATPYEWSQALADQLASGVLLTRDGDGHTGYHTGSACTDKAIDAYLLEGTPPDEGTRCATS